MMRKSNLKMIIKMRPAQLSRQCRDKMLEATITRETALFFPP